METKSKEQTGMATHEEICDQALEHYEKLATECHHWFSTVPRAIKFYREYKDKIQPPALPLSAQARIEAAIRKLEQNFDKMKIRDPKGWRPLWNLTRNINLLKYILNQPQEGKGFVDCTWTDKDFGFIPTKEGLDKETTRSNEETKK